MAGVMSASPDLLDKCCLSDHATVLDLTSNLVLEITQKTSKPHVLNQFRKALGCLKDGVDKIDFIPSQLIIFTLLDEMPGLETIKRIKHSIPDRKRVFLDILKVELKKNSYGAVDETRVPASGMITAEALKYPTDTEFVCAMCSCYISL